METSMISVEEFLADTNVPILAGGNPIAQNVSTMAGGNPIAHENEQLKQEVNALRFQSSETKVIAENYAEHVRPEVL